MFYLCIEFAIRGSVKVKVPRPSKGDDDKKKESPAYVEKVFTMWAKLRKHVKMQLLAHHKDAPRRVDEDLDAGSDYADDVAALSEHDDDHVDQEVMKKVGLATGAQGPERLNKIIKLVRGDPKLCSRCASFAKEWTESVMEKLALAKKFHVPFAKLRAEVWGVVFASTSNPFLEACATTKIDDKLSLLRKLLRWVYGILGTVLDSTVLDMMFLWYDVVNELEEFSRVSVINPLLAGLAEAWPNLASLEAGLRARAACTLCVLDDFIEAVDACQESHKDRFAMFEGVANMLRPIMGSMQQDLLPAIAATESSFGSIDAWVECWAKLIPNAVEADAQVVAQEQVVVGMCVCDV